MTSTRNTNWNIAAAGYQDVMPSYEFDAKRVDPAYKFNDVHKVLLSTSHREISPLFKLRLSIFSGSRMNLGNNWGFYDREIRDLMVMEVEQYVSLRDSGLSDKVIAHALATNYWQKPLLDIGGILVPCGDDYSLRGSFMAVHQPYLDSVELAAIPYMLCYQPKSARDLDEALRIVNLLPVTGVVDPSVLAMMTSYSRQLTKEEIDVIHPYTSIGCSIDMAFNFINHGIDSELVSGMAQR